jgi:predicted membrane-bound spermidine synthase
MATVLLELILTRLFSASAGYHFAFMIVSMTMFGMTAGALYAFTRTPADSDALYVTLSRYTCLFALSIPVAYIANTFFSDAMLKVGPFAWIGFTFLLYSIVFFFSGVCVSHCLTRFREVGKLYAADLLGAGISCPLLIIGLSYADPQVIVIVAGLFAVVASVCFASKIMQKAKQKNQVEIACGVAVVCLVTAFVPQHINLVSNFFGKVDLIKWSPIGRVIATRLRSPAVSWAKVAGVAPQAVAQVGLFIDFGAFTVMTSGKATEKEVLPITHDVTAVGNRLRPGRSLFVIGVGGGRDVLTGLLYNQKKIDGIEVNPAIVWMLKDQYADFNGHLTERPGVTIINDEARNWLARSGNKYGIIQCSLVDTWSASSSGAFMLTENTLYTKEAFKLYLKHVDQDGILCFLRWGDEHESGQILRMLYLAKNALLEAGVTDVGTHIMLIDAVSEFGGHNIGTMLVSPTAFSPADIKNLTEIARAEGYNPLWIPGVRQVEPFAHAISSAATDPGMPTDDRPFFFTPVKPSQTESSIGEPAQGKGLALLFFTFAQAAILVLIVIVFPVLKTCRHKLGTLRQAATSGLFFASLGVAFMLIEVAQVQRLTILLGNPTYGLSVVLFALLLASGAGSFVVQMLIDRGQPPRKLLVIALVCAASFSLATAWIFGNVLGSLEAAQLGSRMAAAIPLVALPGFFMGWGFPLGMTIFTKDAPTGGAWFWAINGATSVLSSVLAAIISIIWGIETTLVVGAVCYLIALVGLL